MTFYVQKTQGLDLVCLYIGFRFSMPMLIAISNDEPVYF